MNQKLRLDLAFDGFCRIATVKMLLKYWNEFGIDIKAQNDEGETALDLLNDMLGRIRWNIRVIDKLKAVKKMFEEEYAKIDNSELNEH